MDQPITIIAPQTGSRPRKVILWVIAGVLLICLFLGVIAFIVLGSVIKPAIYVDPKQVRDVASRIADYSLPAGYSEGTASILQYSTTVMFISRSEDDTIWLQQQGLPGGPSPDDLLRHSITIAKYLGVQWQAVGTKTAMIRDEQSLLTVYTGLGADGLKYQAWAGPFKGKGGPAILVIVATEATWEDKVAQEFVDSLH